MLTRAVLATVVLATACGGPQKPPAAAPTQSPVSVSTAPVAATTAAPEPTPSMWAQDTAGGRLCALVKPLWGTYATLDPKALRAAAEATVGLTLQAHATALRLAAQDAINHPDGVRMLELGQRVDEMAQRCLQAGYYG